MKNTIKTIALAGMLAVGGYNSQALAQRRVDSNQELSEVLGSNEIIVKDKEYLSEIADHEKFINTNIYELRNIYGEKKALELINQHLLIEINNIRKKYEKQELTINKELQNFSQKRADYLFKNKKLEHGEGNENLVHRLNNYGITNRQYCGENLGQGQTSIKKIIDGWMNSPGHRELILKEDFDSLGLGLAYTKIDKKTTCLCSTWVLVFLGK